MTCIVYSTLIETSQLPHTIKKHDLQAFLCFQLVNQEIKFELQMVLTLIPDIDYTQYDNMVKANQCLFIELQKLKRKDG